MGYYVDGVYYKTMTDVAKAYNMTLSGLSRRVSRNRMTVEEAVLDFKSKCLEGTPCSANGRDYISAAELEKEYKLPIGSFNRVTRNTGWPAEIVIAALQRKKAYSKIYVYEGKIYFSKDEMCEAHGTTANTVKVCEAYYGVDYLYAFEIRTGKRKPPKKEASPMPKMYRVEVQPEPFYIEIAANSESEAAEKAEDYLDNANDEEVQVLFQSGYEIKDIEQTEHGPDTSEER